MNESEHDNSKVDHHRKPYWKHAHHDWRFWVGFVLMLAAIAYYVLSVDFSLRPSQQKNNHKNTESYMFPL